MSQSDIDELPNLTMDKFSLLFAENCLFSEQRKHQHHS